MHLSPEELARVEAMMERGQVFSAPAQPSPTDRMLDRLEAAAPRRATASAPARKPAGPRRAADWLDLPALEELLATRRALLRRSTEGTPLPPAGAAPEA